MSGIETDEFVRCVNAGDSQRLTALPGIGKKTAERLVVEMRDRVADLPNQAAKSGVAVTSNADATTDAVSGLVALGYKPVEASKLIHALDAEEKTSEDLIREALKNLI